MTIFVIATLVAAVGTIGLIAGAFEEAQAVKGEAGQHISSEGRANQSPQGAVSSGVGGYCPGGCLVG
jgi:hypothetical protein